MSATIDGKKLPSGLTKLQLQKYLIDHGGENFQAMSHEDIDRYYEQYQNGTAHFESKGPNAAHRGDSPGASGEYRVPVEGQPIGAKPVEQWSTPQAPTPGSPPAKGAPGGSTTAPDLSGGIDKSNLNPDQKSFLKNFLATHQGDTSSVSYWNASGVDPTAPVLGTVNYGPNTHNTMSASGLMQHGPEGPVPITQSADKWLQRLYTMSAPEVLDLQHRLWDQGWYSGSKITDFSQLSKGQPDAATLTAYISALAETARYNHAGRRIGIDGVIGLGSPDAATAKAAQGQPFEKTNPADLRAALNAEAQQSLGRDATPQEADAYAHKYLAEEEAARRELIAAGYANRTEGVTGPPSASAGAAQFVDVNNLADKVAYGAAVKQQQFFAMLRSPV